MALTSRLVWTWALVFVATPALMFPLAWPRVTAGVLAVVLGLVVADAIVGRRRSVPAVPAILRVPLAIFAACVLVGVYVAPSLDLMVPKLCGLLMGALLFRAVVVTGVTLSRIRILVLAYACCGAAVAVSGVLATPSWPDKVKPLRAIALRIPTMVTGLPGADAGVNANALGGTTLFFLPLLAVLGIAWWRQPRGARPRWTARGVAAAAALGISGVLLLSVLLLSQSRTAWASSVIAWAAVVALGIRTARWIRTAVAGALVGVAVFLTVWLWPPPAERPSLMTHVGGRAFTWTLALDAIVSRPLTGVGLGGFRLIAESLQPANQPRLDVPNAHNTFLQVALDTGIPGLAAYLALLFGATKMTFALRRHPACDEHATLCFGLWAGLLAVHLFGIPDAIAPGAKVGIFLWWNLGLITALHALAVGRSALPINDNVRSSSNRVEKPDHIEN